MAELWWLLAVFSGMITGVMIYTNQIFQMPSSLVMVYRGILQSILLLPFFFFFEFPQDPIFWFLVMLQGLLVAYSDNRTFLCSKLYGGEIAGAIKPYVIIFVFILWLILRPAQFFEFLDEPVKFGIIILCFMAIIGSLRLICKGNVSKAAFLLMLPALINSSFIEVNNKYITTLGAATSLSSAIFYYCWMTAFFSGLPNLIRFLRSHDWHMIIEKRNMKGGLIIILCILAGNILKNTAMFYTPNPAYVSAIIALYPIWIILWNNFYYRRKDAEKYPRCNFAAVGLLLLSVITLILVQ